MKNLLEGIAQKISEPYSREAYDKKMEAAWRPDVLADSRPEDSPIFVEGEALKTMREVATEQWQQNVAELEKFHAKGEKEAYNLNKEYEKLKTEMARTKTEIEEWEIEIGLRKPKVEFVHEGAPHRGTVTRVEVPRVSKLDRKSSKDLCQGVLDELRITQQELAESGQPMARVGEEALGQPMPKDNPAYELATKIATLQKRKAGLEKYAKEKLERLKKQQKTAQNALTKFEREKLGSRE